MSKKTNKIVNIDGVQYIKKNGKLYGLPRTVTNRKILRNRLRILLKQQGYTKVNKLMKHYWKNPEIQKRISMI